MKTLGIAFFLLGLIILGSVTTYLTLVAQAVQTGRTTAAKAANSGSWTKQPATAAGPAGAFANGTAPAGRLRGGGGGSASPTTVTAPGYNPESPKSNLGWATVPAMYAGTGTPPSYPGSTTPPIYAGTGMPNTNGNLNAVRPPGGRSSATGNTASSLSAGMNGGQSLSGVNNIPSTALLSAGSTATGATALSGTTDAGSAGGTPAVSGTGIATASSPLQQQQQQQQRGP
jgi:hypothetical protein